MCTARRVCRLGPDATTRGNARPQRAVHAELPNHVLSRLGRENEETVIDADEAAAVAATALDTPLRLVNAAGEEGEVGDAGARRGPAVAGRLGPAVVGRLDGGLADAGRERAEREPLLAVALLAGMFRLCGNNDLK